MAHDVQMTSTLRPLLVPGARLYRLGLNTAVIGSNPGTTVALRPGTLELLQLIDGIRDLETLQRLLRREVPEFEGHVRDVLVPLIQSGAVLPQRPPQLRMTAPLFTTDGPANEFARRLEQALRPAFDSNRNNPDWHIIISTGEPARGALEQFIIEGIPHLLIVLDEDIVQIGPLTLPMSTPCVNCYDEFRSRQEPRWSAMRSQFGTSRLECGVSLTTQYAAIATLLREFERDGSDSLIGQRLSVSARDQRRVHFGFAARCHCHLLAA